eukprot:6405951-Ditylum_brightwellii.AAC.3
MPPVLISSSTVPKIEHLHPQQGVVGTNPEVQHPVSNTDNDFLNYDNKTLHKIFTSLKTGKVSGLFADATDLLRDVAL